MKCNFQIIRPHGKYLKIKKQNKQFCYFSKQPKIAGLNIIYTLSMSLRSSLQLTTSNPLERDDITKLKTVWQHLYDHHESIDFRVPVDWETYGLVDYPQLIKYPMDLGTVNEKLNKGEYSTVQEMLDDIQMIWDNCKHYNMPGTWIYKLADKLQKNYKKLLKNYFPQIPFMMAPGKSSQSVGKKKAPSKKEKQSQIFNEEEEEKISYSEKVTFSEKLKVLSPEELGQVVQKIMQSCPTAFVEKEDQKVQILLENIDIIAFREISAFVDQLRDDGEGSVSSKKIKVN